MKSRQLIFFFVKLFIVWLLLFFIQRIFFLTVHAGNNLTLTDFIKCCFYGLPLDISMFFYLMIIPWLMIIISFIAGKERYPLKITGIYMVVMFFISNIIAGIDTGLYSQWGSRINDKFFFYLSFPKEAFASVISMQSLELFLFAAVMTVIFSMIYYRFVQIKETGASGTFRVLFAILFLLISIPAIRGGFQRIPIGKHWCYYSTKAVCNQGAINGYWNFLDAMTHNGEKRGSSYKFYSESELKGICSQLMQKKGDSVTRIFAEKTRPNIILFVLESWSAEATGIFGNKNNVTPVFDSLVKEGFLFRNFYASGFRTDQALVALLSSFPSQPSSTIIREPGKFDKLPFFSLVLDSAGYSCRYYCGSNSDFANTSAFLKAAGFQKIIDIDDFPLDTRTYWGAYDADVFRYEAEDAKSSHQPFFHMIASITSHEPFDAKVPVRFKGEGIVSDYMNTVAYTDHCLGDYFRKVKNQSWYKNTIFIITADHAHSLPQNREMRDPQRFRIPFLIVGEPLNKALKGKEAVHYGSQTDFAPVILSQLNISNEKFRWGKDIMNASANDFAYFCFEDGFGWITPAGMIVYDNQSRKIIYREPSSADTTGVISGKAYLQWYMGEYGRF